MLINYNVKELTMKKNQQGFTLVEGLLVLLVVAIIAFIGYYVVNTQKSNKVNVNSTSSKTPNSTATPDKSSTTKTTPTAISEADAKTFLQDFYMGSDHYFTVAPQPADPASDPRVSDSVRAQIKQDAAAGPTYNHFTCVQNTIDGFSSSKLSATDNSITMRGDVQVNGSDGLTHHYVDVTLVPKGNSFQIDKLSCEQ